MCIRDRSSSCTLIFSLVHTFSSDLDQHICVQSHPKPALLDISVQNSYFLSLELLTIPMSFRTFGLDNFSVHHHTCLSRWVNFHNVYLKQYSGRVYFMIRYFLLPLIKMLEITRMILSRIQLPATCSKHNYLCSHCFSSSTNGCFHDVEQLILFDEGDSLASMNIY